MRAIIAVVGDTHVDRNSEKWELAVSLGKSLVDAGFRIVSGGLGDLPRALAEGARKSKDYQDGSLIAIIPSYDPADAESNADIVIATGLDHARNLIVANSDAVIVIGGGAGTLSEIAFAWSLKRLIIALNTPGWGEKLINTRLDDRVRYPDIKDDKIYGANSAEEATQKLVSLLPHYTNRHSRILVKRAKEL